MTPRTPTLPSTEPAMWLKLLTRVHPDAGGDHETFIWTMNLRDAVCNGATESHPKEEARPQPPPPSQPQQSPDCIPFDMSRDHDELTAHAVIIAKDLPEPYAAVLRSLRDCEDAYLGPLSDQQKKGATYRQLAATAYAAGMSKAQRIQWYAIAESIPLSRRHAGHILSKLKGAT